MTSFSASSSPLGFEGAGVGKEMGVPGWGSGVDEWEDEDGPGAARALSFEGKGGVDALVGKGRAARL